MYPREWRIAIPVSLMRVDYFLDVLAVCRTWDQSQSLRLGLKFIFPGQMLFLFAYLLSYYTFRRF